MVDVGQPRHAVLVPPVRPRPGVIMREVAPRVTVVAIVLADRPPRPFGQVGAPLVPGIRLEQVVLRRPGGLRQSRMLRGHPGGRCGRRRFGHRGPLAGQRRVDKPAKGNADRKIRALASPTDDASKSRARHTPCQSPDDRPDPARHDRRRPHHPARPGSRAYIDNSPSIHRHRPVLRTHCAERAHRPVRQPTHRRPATPRGRHHRLTHDVPGRMAGYVTHAQCPISLFTPARGRPDDPGSKSDIWGRKFCSSSGSAAAVRPGEAGQTGPGTSVEIHRPTRLVDETGD